MECYGNLKKNQREKVCLPPCEGLYADIKKDSDAIALYTSGKFKRLLEQYEDFKRGFARNIEYPRLLKGMNRPIQYRFGTVCPQLQGLRKNQIFAL